MATNKPKDWGSIFKAPQDQTAIPEPSTPKPNDWASIVVDQPDSAIPEVPTFEKPAPDVPNQYRQGWGSLEIAKPFVEGAKNIGESVRTTMEVPGLVAKDIGRRVGIIDDEPKIEKTNNLQEIYETISGGAGAVPNPMKVFLGLMKIGGALEPDVAYQLRQQGKKDQVQIAEQFITAAPQMAVNMFSGIVGGKAGAVTSAFAQIYGDAFKKYREDHNDTEAAGLAMVQAIPQSLIESASTIFMLGGMKAFKPLASNKAFAKIAKTMNGKSLKWLQEQADTVIGRISGSIATEGAEEYAQSITEMISDLISLKMRGGEITASNIKNLFAQKHKEGKRAAIVGALWGGVGGAAGIGLEKTFKPAVSGDVDPDAVDTVEDKTDARKILEQAGQRWVEEQTAIPEDPGAMMPVEGAIPEGAQVVEMTPEPVVEGPPPVPGPPPIPEPPPIPMEPIVDTIVEAEPEKDTSGDDIAQSVMRGEIDDDTGRQAFIENYMAKPTARPDWGTRTEAVAQPETDFEIMYNQGLMEEASRAYDVATGKSKVAESQTVTQYKEYLKDQFKGIAEKYGDDFVRQVPKEELSPPQRLWVQVVEQLYNKPIFFIEPSKKLKGNVKKKISKKLGARMPGTSGIVISKSDPIRNTGTIFHELTHGMNRQAPQVWRKLSRFIRDNALEGEIEKFHRGLVKAYTEDSPDFSPDANILNDELVAEFVGGIMENREAQVRLLEKLKLADPTLFQKTVRYIKQSVQKLIDFIAGKKAPGSALLIKDLEAGMEHVTDILAQYQGISEKQGPAKGMTRKQSVTPTFRIDTAEKQDKLWFSAMNKFLSKALPGKGGGKQYAQLIENWSKKGNFKKEELEWSGLLDWLQKQKGVITKKDILDY